jgi:hypothetical protein
MVFAQTLFAQQPIKSYSVKDGQMYVQVSRQIKESSLDSFINQFGLDDIGLKQLIKTNQADSLLKLGWKVELNDRMRFIISKPFYSLGNINNSADKIIFTEKHPTIAEMFPAVNNGILYGINRFNNKNPFAEKNSVVTFFIRDHLEAKRVYLAGSFNNWNPDDLLMRKTEGGWTAEVTLSAGKYWYKFIVDGAWMIDNDNQLRENDGQGNINSVFYRTNTLFTLPGYEKTRKVFLSGSFNNWRRSELAMTKTAAGWELPIYLAEGTFTYKFITDGQWLTDELNKERLPDGSGGFNSVLRIGSPYLFKLNGNTSAKQVLLAGSFNGWRDNELLMRRTSTGWELPYTLGPGNYEYKFKVDNQWIRDPANPILNNNSGSSYLIIQPNYTFRLKGFSNAKQVFLAGDFNNWSTRSLGMRKEGEEWVFRVHLAVGKHRYKFLVDDNWILDPNNKLWEQNEYGTGNSIIWIQ